MQKGKGTKFTEEQIERYSRHIILPEVGGVGQKKIMAAKVLVVGAGGLGSPAAFYLTAAGVGVLGLVDFDRVDPTNLQRQILHSTADIGRLKTESAKEKLNALNPEVEVRSHTVKLTSDNIMDIVKEYDIVLDGSDNFPTRYLLNDACFLSEKTIVHGSIFRFEGQVTVFKPKEGPCYRCLFPVPPPPGLVPSCQEAGVLGVLPGLIGTVQAVETLKLILGIGETLVGRLLLYDSLNMSFREVTIKADPDCPLCGKEPSILGLIDYEAFCGVQG